MAGQLYRNISAAAFAGHTFTDVTAIGVTEGGQEISSAADEAAEEQLVDLVDMTTVVSIYTDDLAVFAHLAQGAAVGTLTATVDSGDGGTGKILTFSNCRFMADDANPKHGNVASAVVLNFECYSTDGTTMPLAITDDVA